MLYFDVTLRVFNFYQQAIKVLQISLSFLQLVFKLFKAQDWVVFISGGLVLIVTLDVSGGCILYPMYFIKIPPFCPKKNFYNSQPCESSWNHHIILSNCSCLRCVIHAKLHWIYSTGIQIGIQFFFSFWSFFMESLSSLIYSILEILAASAFQSSDSCLFKKQDWWSGRYKLSAVRQALEEYYTTWGI